MTLPGSAQANAIHSDDTAEGATPGAPTTITRGIRLAIVLALLVVIKLLPSDAQLVLGVIAALALPVAAWTFTLRTYLRSDGILSFGAAIILVLAAWSLLQFLALLAQTDVNYLVSAILLVVILALPIYINPRLDVRGFLETQSAEFGASAGLSALIVVLFGSGIAVMALTMHQAADQLVSVPTSFVIYFAGLILLLAPGLAALIWRPKHLTIVALIAVSLAVYIPTWIRAANAPYATDEIAHWAESLRMISHGELFTSDPVLPIGIKFPGLETLYSGIAGLAGQHLFWMARLLVALMHVAAVIGILQLGRIMSPPSRQFPVIAAALYAVTPSFIVIDSWFSYESFAIPMAIWFIAFALLYASSAEASPIHGIAALLLGLTLIITHHLTTYVLVAALVIILLPTAYLLRNKDTITTGRSVAPTVSPARVAFIGIALGLGAAGWAVAVDAPVIAYLSVFPKSAYTAASNLIVHQQLSYTKDATTFSGRFNGIRPIFNASYLPLYERVASIALQPVLFVIFVFSALTIYRRRKITEVFFLILGFLYFLSLPLTFVSGAGSGAHRSWAFSWIGLALVLPMAWVTRDTGALRATFRKFAAATSACMALITLGNYGAGVSVYYMLPGGFVLGSDSRGYSTDMIDSAKWFNANVGPRRIVTTDFRDSVIFGAYADAVQSRFLPWTLFFPEEDPGLGVRHEMEKTHTQFVIVNRRLATDPTTTVYFRLSEPLPPSIPLPHQSIDKFSSMKWLKLIHSEGQIDIYQVTSYS